MSMHSALQAYLAGDAQVAAAVNSVRWNEIPQAGALPAIALSLASEQTPAAHSGGSSLRICRVQIDCFAASVSAALAAVEAVRPLVNGVTTPELRAMTIDGGGDSAAKSGAVMVYGQRLDVMVTTEGNGP